MSGVGDNGREKTQKAQKERRQDNGRFIMAVVGSLLRYLRFFAVQFFAFSF
jgi:hypothetical protein